MPEEPVHHAEPIGLHFLPGVTLVRLYGVLTGENPLDVETLALGLAATHRPVVVNVAGVTGMSIDGLRWLMRLTGPVRGQGAGLILESPTSCVEDMLTLTGCHTWFNAATRPGPDARTDTTWLLKALSGTATDRSPDPAHLTGISGSGRLNRFAFR